MRRITIDFLFEDVVSRTVIGLMLCSSLATTAAWLFIDHPYRASVPLGFIVIGTVVAFFFGELGAISGLLAAAVLFAVFMFRPLGSWSVASEAARANLGWMIVLGSVCAFLLAPSASLTRHKSVRVHSDKSDRERSER